jgi:hypothetical protein
MVILRIQVLRIPMELVQQQDKLQWMVALLGLSSELHIIVV